MDKRQIFNTSQSPLIRYSFNQVYGLTNTSVMNTVEPPVVKYILTTNSILGLSLNTFRLKKHATKAAFKTHFCRGLAGNCDIQTVQIVLHYSSESCTNKTRMIASINSPLVSSISELKAVAAGDALAIPFNFENKDLNQNKKKDFALRNKSKLITKSKKRYYLEPVIGNKTFVTPTNLRLFTPKGKYFQKPDKVLIRPYTVLKEAAFSTFTLMRAPFSFKRKTLDKEIIVKNSYRFNELYPASYFLPFAFLPVLSFNNQKKNTNQKRIKACSFKETKSLTRMRADWVLNQLIDQFSRLEKKNPRALMNQLINDIRILIERTGSECPVIGARITLTGRLGSRKKGMAQQISKCVGKIPLSTLRQKVDYSQGFLASRLGLIGVKVWICYKQSP